MRRGESRQGDLAPAGFPAGAPLAAAQEARPRAAASPVGAHRDAPARRRAVHEPPLQAPALRPLLVVLLLSIALPSFAFAQTASTDQPAGQARDDTNAAAARSVTPFLRNVLKSDQPVTLEADSVEYDDLRKIYRASGHAVLRAGANALSADFMTVDLERRQLMADGMVTMTTPDGTMQNDGMVMNLDSETAVMARAAFVVKKDEVTFFLRGRRIEKVGPDRYLIYDGSYTTCDCGPEDADWMVTAEYIDVTFDGYAVVQRGRVYWRGLAVAYLPYGVFPAKVNRDSGFLWPETGWASDDGYRFSLPYYWNIAPHADATLYTEWYENRGTKLGADYRYMMNKRWYGEVDGYAIQDRMVDNEMRYTVGYEQQFNPWRRLYVRNQVNLISDRDYVADFPREVEGRYDRYIRSDIIANNLWDDYDFNVDFQHWRALTEDDNATTWQHYPQMQFNTIARQLGPIPLYFRGESQSNNFYRAKITDAEQATDLAMGHETPYYFLKQGRRMAISPELYSPLNFDQYATLTPYAKGEGAFYQTDERATHKTDDRFSGELGARAFTRFERAFPTSYVVTRGIKHQIEPDLEYRYRPEPEQDDLPIYDGEDRLKEVSELTYGLTNRLWMRLFNAMKKRFETFKLTDLRLLHGYDFAEADRPLDPADPQDERRPWLPIRAELETLASPSDWLTKILVRSDADYSTYQDKITGFSAMTAMTTANDDGLGAEYRFHRDRDDVVDINFISGLARYTLVDFITFDYLARYSFIDTYFIEQRYGVEFHSPQHCWNVKVNYERHSIPKHEDVILLMLDLTGLAQAGTSF